MCFLLSPHYHRVYDNFGRDLTVHKITFSSRTALLEGFCATHRCGSSVSLNAWNDGHGSLSAWSKEARACFQP